jgi:hypothetical protein
MLNLPPPIVGVAAFRDLGVDQVPNVELPIITVTTTFRGVAPRRWKPRSPDPSRKSSTRWKDSMS